MVGTDSRTARVSVARRNLKEAAGKVLARRTGIAYEAVTSGREGIYLQSPITILPASRGVGMGWQKSAEAIGVGVTSRQRAEHEVNGQEPEFR